MKKLDLENVKNYYKSVSAESREGLEKDVLVRMEWGDHETLYKAEYMLSFIEYLKPENTLEEILTITKDSLVILTTYASSTNEAANRCNILKMQALGDFLLKANRYFTLNINF